jgi:hypothetical protein
MNYGKKVSFHTHSLHCRKQPIPQQPRMGHNWLGKCTQLTIECVLVLVGLGQERCGPHQGRIPSNSDIRCLPCIATVLECELKQIWQLAHSNPTSC